MNKLINRAAFVVGLLAVGWIAAGYLRTNPLALTMTGLILAAYLMGALELRRYDQATSALTHTLHATTEPPADLGAWLARLPASLQTAVRLRVEGDRVALPGPALTPYLSGLLVLLGMLGTFVGMVVTLNGTGAALESATDLQTMRNSLAAPVKGLGLAFGTSVAGVAASAMLGLMSALCRRARVQAGQALDGRIATVLRLHTRAHQRQQSLELMQAQAALMPALVDRMQMLMAQLEAQAARSGEQLLAGQQRFHEQGDARHRALADAVEQSLRLSLAETTRLTAATIQPVVETTLHGLARESAELHGRLAGTVQQQFDGVAARLDMTLQQLSTHWQQVQDRRAAEVAASDEKRLAAWTAELQATASALHDEWQRAGSRTLDQQTQICATLEQTAARIATQSEAHARSTIAEVARLVQTASEAPRIAAEVVGQLRDKLSENLARDNAMLDERARIMATLVTLLDAVQQGSTEQQAAITALVASGTALLQQAGERHAEKLATESARNESLAAQLGASAVEVASLGEAFGLAVGLFGQSSDRTVAQLQRLEEALARSTARSDEQLAYYVAQAREVIDLSLAAQQQVIEDLQRMARNQATAGSEA